MIINFDQTPEEYYRLSRISFEHKELDRALLYAQKAVRGKGTAEHKLGYAEILFAMERYPETIAVALDVLCHSKALRAETYDLLARTASELGLLYESLHYISKKAHYEGDDDTLDAMDEVMRELDAEEEEKPKEHDNLFVVGKEPSSDDSTLLMHASYAMSRGEVEQALRKASEIPETSPHYLDARLIRLHALLSMKREEEAGETAKEIVKLSPTNGYALYELIDHFKDTTYLPLLAGVEGGSRELYYAIVAAEHMKEHSVADALADKLLREKPYSSNAYWIASAIALNNGDKEKSKDLLKRLFALYPDYPAQLILNGWKRLKYCDAIFEGKLPEKVVRILRNYVRKNAEDADAFCRSMMTDESFRGAISLLFDEGDPEVAGNVLSFLAVTSTKQIDDFFAKMLLRYEVDLVLKRAILSRLLLRKHKGRISLAQGIVTTSVSAAKPARFESYSPALKEAYLDVSSFVVCLTESRSEKRVTELAERAFAFGDSPIFTKEALSGAMIYVLLSEGAIPSGNRADFEEECKFILSFIFHENYLPMTTVKRLAKILSY